MEIGDNLPYLDQQRNATFNCRHCDGFGFGECVSTGGQQPRYRSGRRNSFQAVRISLLGTPSTRRPLADDTQGAAESACLETTPKFCAVAMASPTIGQGVGTIPVGTDRTIEVSTPQRIAYCAAPSSTTGPTSVNNDVFERPGLRCPSRITYYRAGLICPLVVTVMLVGRAVEPAKSHYPSLVPGEKSSIQSGQNLQRGETGAPVRIEDQFAASVPHFKPCAIITLSQR